LGLLTALVERRHAGLQFLQLALQGLRLGLGIGMLGLELLQAQRIGGFNGLLVSAQALAASL